MVFTTQLEPLPKEVFPITVERLVHLKGCARQSAKLAHRFGEDEERAYTAGLYHDLARDWNDEQARSYVHKFNINVDTKEVAAGVGLLHSPISADLAERVFGVEDERILEAIRYHTTGWEQVSKLGAILMVADVSEPNRGKNFLCRIEKILKMGDIFDILIEVLILKEEYLRDKGVEPHPMHRRTLSKLLERRRID